MDVVMPRLGRKKSPAAKLGQLSPPRSRVLRVLRS